MFGGVCWGEVAWGDYRHAAVVAPVVTPPTPTPTPTPSPPPQPQPIVGQIVPPVTVGNTWGWSGLDEFYQALDSFYDDLRREQERLAKKKKRKKKKEQLSPLANRLLAFDPAEIRVAPPRFDSEGEDLWLLGIDLYMAEEHGSV